MPLWGKTDANADKPKNWSASMTGGQLIYVDETEASLEANKERGLNAPGWWEYLSYTDSSGTTRHKAIHLINLVSTTTVETQTDDAIAADVTSTITISAQPTDQSTDDVDGTATFSVTATASAGSVVYQWQVQTATGTRWTNVTGATSDSLNLTGLTTTDSGRKYRVKLTSTAGAAEVISDVATLTVTVG